MFKDWKENVSRRRKIKILKSQIELVERKTAIYEMKKVLVGIDSRSDSEEEKVKELEEIAIKTTKWTSEGK